MKKAFYLFMLCLLLAGCGSDTTKNQFSEEENKDKVSGQSEKVSKEEKNGGFELKQVGETFILKDWEVTLESYKFDESVSDGQATTSADEGNKFLVLNFKVTNNGTEADQLLKNRSSVLLKAVYNEKYDYATTVTLNDGDLHHENVRPLSTTEGFAVIAMPDNVVEATESVNLFLENGEDKVQIKIR